MEHNILFVDDEAHILKAMERIFHASPFHLFFAERGEEGLAYLKKRSFSVIFSDMKMPGMSGIDFLRAAEDYAPDSIRIILSGYSDINDILMAVNEGHVHNYLTKPWDSERLKIVLYNGTISYEKNIQVKNLAEQLKDKNSRLEAMNNDLEAIVERRSRELSLRNKILFHMLKEPDTSKNLTLCLKAIGEILGDVRVSLVFEGEASRSLGLENLGPNLPERIGSLLGNVTAPSYIKDYFAYPLELRGRIVCHLVITLLDGDKRALLPDVVSLSNMVKLILQQHSNLFSSRHLMDSIDDLLEGM